jgi:hypothetical protein
MSNDYTLEFDLSSYKDLDNFALLANQSYNLGDNDDWFGQFRGGLYGLYNRILGVKIHYREVHSWTPPLSPISGIQGAEYHNIIYHQFFSIWTRQSNVWSLH